MRSTLVGIFDDRSAAERARSELLRTGFADDEVDLRTGTDDEAWRTADDPSAYDDQSEATIGETVAGWFSSLFGIDDDEDVDVYTEAMRRGQSVVTVRTTDQDRVDRASDILEACGSIDIDEKADEWQAQGWARPPATRDRNGPSTTTPSAPLGATADSADAMGAASTRRVGDRIAGADRTAQATRDDIPATDARAADARVGKRIVGRRRLRVYTQTVDEPVQPSPPKPRR